MNIKEQRLYKVKKIKALYDIRNTQEFIAQKYMMDKNDVGKTLRILGYSHTRKKDISNLNDGENIKPYYMADEFQFLDKYKLNNFV